MVRIAGDTTHGVNRPSRLSLKPAILPHCSLYNYATDCSQAFKCTSIILKDNEETSFKNVFHNANYALNLFHTLSPSSFAPFAVSLASVSGW